MTENKEKKLKTASVLAFESKLANSDATMMAGNWDDRDNAALWQPVKIQEKAVRGTISNRLSSKDPEFKDPARLDAKISNANIQVVDNAALPFEADTLKINYTLRVLGNLDKPSACNDPDYQSALTTVIKNYRDQYKFTELAKRYAKNIANGRFLWRNRVGAEFVEVQVKTNDDLLVFDAYEVGLGDFSATEKVKNYLSKLAIVIQQGLTGKASSFIEVNAFAKLGKGQMVYPSQEMVMGGGSGDKKKFLYQLNGDDPKNSIAAMHSQKIGNALRTIDTWHSEAKEVGPIAIEPYGSVTNRGKAYRPLKKGDFYTIFDAWIIKGKEPTIEEQHYVMAVLIRGGVFGKKG